LVPLNSLKWPGQQLLELSHSLGMSLVGDGLPLVRQGAIIGTLLE
jgi:hypothetical protein